MEGNSEMPAPLVPVLATYDQDGEAWWYGEPWDDSYTDVRGGQVVGVVPLALWQNYLQVRELLDDARAALCEALGLNPVDMTLAKPCGGYVGQSVSQSGVVYWRACDTCGWPRGDHD